MNMQIVGTAILAMGLCASARAGTIRITEYMYSGNGNEFFELCNVGVTPQDMTGWSYDDDSAIPGTVDLSLFGTVNAGDCVIVAEATAGAFNTDWSLGGVVPILGGLTVNLGRNDDINIFDQNDLLVDKLDFGDQEHIGSIRAQNATGWVSAAGLGANDAYAWTLSTVSDFQNSYESNSGDIGSPGAHIVPEPAAHTLMGLGAVLFRRRL